MKKRLLRRAAVLVDREQGAPIVPAARPRPRWENAARRPAPRVREQVARAVREVPAARRAFEGPARRRGTVVDLMEDLNPGAPMRALRRRVATPVLRRRRPAVDADTADRLPLASRVVEQPPQRPAAIAEQRQHMGFSGLFAPLVLGRQPPAPVNVAAPVVPPAVVIHQMFAPGAPNDQPPPAADPMSTAQRRHDRRIRAMADQLLDVANCTHPIRWRATSDNRQRRAECELCQTTKPTVYVCKHCHIQACYACRRNRLRQGLPEKALDAVVKALRARSEA
ncbi:hypothetical protein LTR95_012361 [Oleoguttula sp. CCFEE 5521]